MSARPAGYDSDIAGRVRGFARTHVVDASVFPSIAATTVTLTSMANAHRIATMARYE
jgi:choline dehydrogenase-like flavoprotein